QTPQPHWQYLSTNLCARPEDDLWPHLSNLARATTYRVCRLRGTANAALGFEFAPYPWLYAQITTGLEWSFNQIEASDPAKDPNNAYKGFETRINYYEPRIGIRRSHLEVYYSIQFLPENRPFTFIPANQTGGTHNRLTDKTHNAGMLLWF
ncbi:MAG: hypothetical protein AAFQ83_23125, partial [Bacteroidota bacterium]